MACCSWSITKCGTRRLNSKFAGAGLELRSVEADSSTVIQCWIPKKHHQEEQQQQQQKIHKKKRQQQQQQEEQQKQRQAVVLIHGFGANALWQWPHQLKALAAEYDLYIPNLIFFGGSTTSSSENRSEIYQAKSLMNVMEILGVHRFHVVGVSYGGFVAFRMAHLFPQAVDKVVIAASGVCMTPDDVDAITHRAGVEYVSDFLLPTSPNELRKLLSLAFYKPPRFVPTCVLRDFVQSLYIEKREQKLELLQGLQLGVKDPTPLPVLTQESLIIWGEHDQIFPLELGQRVKSHLGDKARMVILKEASHAVQIEKARQFNEEILKFFACTPAAPKKSPATPKKHC